MFSHCSFSPLPLMIACMAVADASAERVDLRVTRVAVFSSGVAYFECDATVEGQASAELTFRTAQINDIIKSLLVHDFDGGTVGVVSYPSRDPIEKALRSFGVDLTGKPTLAELLDQLRGEPVEIAGPRSLRGLILGVEKHKIAVDRDTIEVDVLNVLTEAGIQQLRLSELGGIRLTNEKIDSELRKALATLALGHDVDKKAVRLSFSGQGRRRVRVAYLLEAPIWKTSYRLALRGGEKPVLQGWATVENATEEDWKEVRLSLVSGRPISFIMDLYSPLYVPRPKVEPELYASLRPPEYEGGIRPAEAEGKELTKTAARGRPRGTPPPSAVRPGMAGGEMALFQSEDAGVAPEGGRVEDWIAEVAKSLPSIAAAEEAGELFDYRIQMPVSINRQNSAMLPIVTGPMEGEKVSIFNPATHPKYPLNGLHLTNTTGMNLMQGPVTVFDSDVYAGEARLPDLRPGEKRLIAYALDLGTGVVVDQKPAHDEVLKARIAKGTFWFQRKLVDARSYLISNKDDKDKTVLLEQAYGNEWKLVEPKEPWERTAQLSRFRVSVPAGQTVSQKVELEQVTDESIAMTSLDNQLIELYLRSRSVSQKVKEALRKLVVLRSELDAVARQRAEQEREVGEVVGEQGRVRQNLQTLDRNSDSYQRQLRKFDELETRIEQLRGQVSRLRVSEQEKRKELEDYLLSVEVE